ncbi:MAG: glucose-methanol-choline oxidoreductase [Rhodobacterales bacterium]|nr:MAG: glucose-methanol-choline oxidoreductase [Rhodobacterales bacterium]
MTEAATQKLWDVIVIGTGMGGGPLGRVLAERGLSVLYLEKGPMGAPAEQQSLDSQVFDPHARLVRGFWPDPIQATLNGHTSEFFAPLGAAVGGSSVFYAATLERPERRDLEPTASMDHPTGGWPVSYDAYLPYFAKTEQMFCIHGQEDPLAADGPSALIPPPQMAPADQALMDAFTASGLHPYHAHMAIRNMPDCLHCLGQKCPHGGKMDGRTAGVLPALETGNAQLIDLCNVTALRGQPGEISHIEAMRGDQKLTFRARRYVLAAGALSSARLLLASACEDWPKGCANSSGLIGRHLMFHLNEIFAIFPKSSSPEPSKAIALRDLYNDAGQRHGMVQAMGVDVAYGEIVYYLNRMLERSPLRRLKFLRHFTRIPALLAVKIFGRAKLFVGLLEDLPYPENRVLFDPQAPERIKLTYSFAPELLQRRKAFRKRIKKALRGQRKAFLSVQAEPNFGHACGTIRFGADPDNSVLDENCRSHDIGNLYVVDASFMPTSMGVNPSLMIAANALRVADHIAAELTDKDATP